jgi:hypothetical protein
MRRRLCLGKKNAPYGRESNGRTRTRRSNISEMPHAVGEKAKHPDASVQPRLPPLRRSGPITRTAHHLIPGIVWSLSIEAVP